MLTPRPYQLTAIERVREKVRAGLFYVLFVLPTGGGKTIVATHIILSAVLKGMRVLFLAHRRELIVQAYKKLIGCTCPADRDHDAWRAATCTGDGLDPKNVGIIMGADKRRKPQASVQVASIDTLRNRPMPTQMVEGVRKPVDLIIIDEAHRCLAKSYVDIIAKAKEANPNLVVIGLTATPFPSGKKELSEIFSSFVTVASMNELIRMGYLAEPTVFTAPPDGLPDLSNVTMRGEDYDIEELSEALDQSGLRGNIVEHWKKHYPGSGGTVCFASSVAHSQHIAADFVEAGVSAEHLDGTTPSGERDAILLRLERGETKVVTNCGVLCEGWDQPSVKTLILARPTKSLILYLQQVGRCLRPWEGVTPIILDHAGNVMEHGLPQDDREIALNKPKRRTRDNNAPPAKICPGFGCFAVIAAGVAFCPVCGHEFVTVSREEPEVEDVDLVVVHAVSTDEKKAFYDDKLAECRLRGWKLGRAYHLFIEKFGHKPPRAWKPSDLPTGVRILSSMQEKLNELKKLQDEAVAKSYKPQWVFVQFKARFGCAPPTQFEISKWHNREVEDLTDDGIQEWAI
jgi:superfamily II DNA or RNA helicase